jgi:thermitase
MARAAETNTLVWQTNQDSVSADIHGEALWPLLEDIARQTGWHIFVEPGASANPSVKFRNLPAGEALQKLLGNLNFAMVPETNGPQELYVFKTTMQSATRPVIVSAAKGKPLKHVPNQLMVKVKPGANIDAIAKAHGAKVVSRNDKLGIYLLEFADANTTDTALGSLQGDPGVAAVEYNNIYNPPPTPQPLANAPAGAGQITLNPDPNSPTDPCTPIVGLIDTGFNSLGSQLDQFIMPAVNVTGDQTPLSSTTPTHGKAMAKAIIDGFAQQATHSSVRILPVDVYGSGETTTSWNVALGVKAAVDGGATVLNMSLAGTSDSPVLDSIIQQAMASGVVIFAAAGNEPVTTPNYPAAIPGVNAVTALSAPGQLASYADYGSFVEMALPGTSIVYMGTQPWVVQGTSPATAYASGIAAGAKAANCVPWSQIESSMAQKFPVPQKGN